MATNALAFGPLSRGSQQAASALGGGAAAFPSIALGRLSGRSFGEPQQAAQVAEPVGLATGAQAPIEEQQPLLPQGEATGERGDITQLPGFQAAVAPGGAAELPSGEELSQPEQRQVSELRNQLNRLAGEGGGAQAQIDAAKALQGANKALSGGLRGYKTAQMATQPGLGDLMSTITNQGIASYPMIVPPANAPMMPTQQFLPGELSVPDLPTPAGAPMMPTQGEGAGAAGATGLSGAGLAGAGAGALVALAPFLAQQAGLTDPYALAGLQVGATVGAPAAAGAVGGATAGTGAAAGAGAGLAAAAPALIASAPILAGVIMQQILAANDAKSAARDMNIRLKNISSQLPGEVQQIQSIPSVLSRLSSSSTPEETAAVLKELNAIQHGYQEGGWESYQKGGATTVGGGSASSDITADLPGVKATLDALNPYWQLADLGRLRGTSQLLAGGLTPSQIEAQGGRYLNPMDVINSFSPETVAALFNAPEGMLPEQYANFNGMPALGLMPGTTLMAPDPGGRPPGMGETGYIETPWGLANRSLYDRLLAMQTSPTYEQDLGDLMRSYGTTLPPEWGMNFGAPAASPATVPTQAAGGDQGAGLALQRLVAQTGGQAGALAPNVPSEWVTALRSPAALQSLLQHPGMLARLFSGGQ